MNQLTNAYCCRLSPYTTTETQYDNTDPNNYRAVRKICHSCGEQSLVKKERKPTSHGFNPYNHHEKADKKETEHNAKLFTKVVPKSKSMAKSPHFRKKNDGSSSDNKPTDDKHSKSTDDKHSKSTEKLNHAKSTNTKGSTKIEAPSPAKNGVTKPDKKVDMLQRQRSNSEHQTKSEKHERKDELKKQKSQNFDHHDRKDGVHKQKSRSDIKDRKDDLLQRPKDHGDRKAEGLQRQKSQSETQKKQPIKPDEKRDSDHKERGSAHERKSDAQKHEVQRRPSKHLHERKTEEQKVGRSSTIEQKKEQRKDACQEKVSQHHEKDAEVKLRRKNSNRHPQHVAPASSGEGAPSVMNESMPGKSSTSKVSSEKKEVEIDSSRKSMKQSVENSHLGTEKKVSTDRHPSKRVVIKRRTTTERTRPRSLSPHRRMPRNNDTNDTKVDAHRNSLKERSKSVGHPQQRQRLAPELHYVHQQAVSRVPKSSTLSTYRSQFFDDVMAQSCLQSLMHKKKLDQV